jgi:hypothetical protein
MSRQEKVLFTSRGHAEENIRNKFLFCCLRVKVGSDFTSMGKWVEALKPLKGQSKNFIDVGGPQFMPKECSDNVSYTNFSRENVPLIHKKSKSIYHSF